MARWVQLQGVVSKGRAIAAPVSGASCVLYRVELPLLTRLLPGQWRETGGVPFTIAVDEPALGGVVVDATRAGLDLGAARRRRIALGRNRETDERMAALFGRMSRRLPTRHVGCRERCVAAGDRVRVSGWLESRIDASGNAHGYRRPPAVPFLAAHFVLRV